MIIQVEGAIVCWLGDILKNVKGAKGSRVMCGARVRACGGV